MTRKREGRQPVRPEGSDLQHLQARAGLGARDERPEVADPESIPDDRLRLIFTCCHPALNADARIALTLREVCGLETEQIAKAFLTSAPTVAQRIVRAKNKIRDASIPYQVPAREELSDRLATVLHVVYLVFNEGYSASAGDAVTRPWAWSSASVSASARVSTPASVRVAWNFCRASESGISLR